MGSIVIMLIALIIDALIGDPKDLWKKIPHPVVLMGNLIKYFDHEFNHKSSSKRKQAGLIGIIVGSAAFSILGLILEMLPFMIIDMIIVAIFLAQKSLTSHAEEVLEALGLSLMEGRLAVAKIVGRDTSHLNESEVVRATVESTAEGFLDGVFAPIFWYLVAGLPGLLVYKFVNTADSMIGYRDERYGEFGWAAARFDDLLNLVPARLTAVLIALLHGLTEVRAIVTDAALHRSPNAGWPEAAMARVVGIALSGPRSYDGRIRDFPYVYPEGRRQAGPADIERAVTVIWRVWAVAILAALAIAAT